MAQRNCSGANVFSASCSSSAGAANGHIAHSSTDEPGIKLADDRGVRGGSDSRPRGASDRPESTEPLGFNNSLGVLVPRANTQMTVADWGQCRVTWGKEHKGRTCIPVWRQDPSYYQWAVARFATLTPEVQDFVRFCQMQMDLDQRPT